MKSVELQQIIDFLGSKVIKVFGNTSGVSIKHLKSLDEVDEFTLDWINPMKSDKQQLAEKSVAMALLTDVEVEYSEVLKLHNKVIVQVNHPKFCIALVGKHYFLPKIEFGIAVSAVIHPNASLGKNVQIGANSYIGDCVIGDNTIIHPNVTIYDKTQIGFNVVIHSGSAICADGLGCIREKDGKLFEFPQLGGVVIEDDVYIGANTLIASGSLSNTIIGKGSKINGLSFIGSNCILGKNVWITGSSMICGSVFVEDNVTIFSSVIVRDQVRIGREALIGMGAVVTRNVPPGETWVGNPAKRKDVK